MKKQYLNQIRPIWYIDQDNTIISKIGSYSKAFELKLPEIFTMSDYEYDKCLSDFNSIFNLLPSYSIIHKMDIYTKRQFNSSNIKTNDDFLGNEYKREFNEVPYIDHKSYLFISKSSPNITKRTSLNSLIFKKDFIPQELKSEADKQDFDNAVMRIEALLKPTSLQLIPLNKDAIISLCESYETLNFTNSKFTADIYQDSTKTKIGDNFITSLAVNSLDCLPCSYNNIYIDKNYKTDTSSLKFSLFHPIGLGFKEDHIVNQIFIKEDKEDVKLALKKIDSYNITFKKGDIANEKNLKDSENFVSTLEDGKHAIRYHANIILWDRNEALLTSKVNIATSNFNSISFTPNKSFDEILPVFWASYPGNAADIGYIDQTFYLTDIQASALSIYETTRKDNISDFGVYLSSRDTGCPIYVDISDLPMKKQITQNRNKMIIGPSGSGKSFTTNHLVNTYLRHNTHVVIVDVGDSYKRLCKLRGGTYLKYTEEKPVSFNPFYISNLDKENYGNNKIESFSKKINVEKKESLIKLIFTLWKKEAGEETRDEDAIIRDGLNEYYDYIATHNQDQFMCFNSYYTFMTETYFPKIKEKEEGKLINDISFKNVLKQFYKGGEYDYLLNSEINIDLLNQKLIIFELDNIKDHPILFPIVTLMIMDTFITKMRLLKNTRKVILIEEAWKAISKTGMASFMKYLYKTVRKHFGEALLVTQELDDIIGNEIIKDTILKNCGAKILLDMSEYQKSFDQIQSMLSLSDNAKELVLSLNKNNIPGKKYKEVFIGLGNEGSVYGVNVSNVEYGTYTTEKSEIERIEELEKKYNCLETALIVFAGEKEKKDNLLNIVKI